MTLARRNASPVASGIAGAVSPGVQAAVAGSSPAKFRPSISVCPELAAYITVLLSVIAAIAWAHVFAMNTTLANQLINFHPKSVICDGLGNNPEFLCAVSHKEGQ